MARKPDTPCAGGCGRLLWQGSSTIGGYGATAAPTCRDCRREHKTIPCEACGSAFYSPGGRKGCSDECSRELTHRIRVARRTLLPDGRSVRDHPLYMTWKGMMARTRNPNQQNYRYYGARGVSACPEWRDSVTFLTWIDANLGPRPEGMTLDRIEVTGNYEPGNVRWAPPPVQARNKNPRPPRPWKCCGSPKGDGHAPGCPALAELAAREARREARAAVAARAQEMRETGVTWREIAEHLGLRDPAHAYVLAKQG